jgi:hypothetical protein
LWIYTELTADSHLVQRLRMNGSVRLLPIHALIAFTGILLLHVMKPRRLWCLVHVARSILAG